MNKESVERNAVDASLKMINYQQKELELKEPPPPP